MVPAYLALGSNLHDPVQQVNSAILELASLSYIHLIKTSSLYRSAPVGLTNQPNFINAVVEIRTSLPAEDLLAELLALEATHLRVRREKNGPRTLDLDLLLYDDKVIDSPYLCVPHPRLKERAFVCLPLKEIAPALVLPCGTSIQTLGAMFQNNAIEVLQ